MFQLAGRIHGSGRQTVHLNISTLSLSDVFGFRLSLADKEASPPHHHRKSAKWGNGSQFGDTSQRECIETSREDQNSDDKTQYRPLRRTGHQGQNKQCQGMDKMVKDRRLPGLDAVQLGQSFFQTMRTKGSQQHGQKTKGRSPLTNTVWIHFSLEYKIKLNDKA